ncbi:MAG: 50S ribosomal protein L10 [Elusimicrobiota bacterium]
MIKTKQEKQEFVKTFEKEIQEKRNFILADYQGLKVSELEDLRKKLQILNAKLFVIRNRLVAKVFKNVGIVGFSEYLKKAKKLTKHYQLLAGLKPCSTLKSLDIKLISGVLESTFP